MRTKSATRWMIRLPLVLSLGLVAAACEECEATRLGDIPEPDDVVDVFDQKAAAQVDILWVIDNSESMAAEQFKIAGRFSDFFRQLIVSQVDYHIGVITTDPAANGVLRPYEGTAVTGCDPAQGCRWITNEVDCDNPDVVTTGLNELEIEQRLLEECQAQAVFRKLITAGIDGSSFEEGFTVAAMATGANVIDAASGFPTGEVPPDNNGFLRPNASLYIVFVSDEDEGAKQDGSPIRYYQRLFESLKGAGNENLVSVSAITGWPRGDELPDLEEVCPILSTTFDGNPATDDPQAAVVKEAMTTQGGCVDESGQEQDANSFAETGSRYIDLACRTGGVVANMCDADYSVALDRLGANAAGLLRKFPISQPEKINAGTDCELFTEDDNIHWLDCDGDGDRTGELDDIICVTARPIGSVPGDEQLRGRDPTNGWVWEASTNSVRFDGNFVPAPGSQVVIQYKLRDFECRQ